MNNVFNESIGIVNVRFIKNKRIIGTPPGGKGIEHGTARVYEVDKSDEWKIQVSDVEWSSGARNIQTMGPCTTAPKPIRRLEHGLRMSVYKQDKNHLYVELSQARVDIDGGTGWSNIYMATMKQLDKGAGIKKGVEKYLKPYGVEIGDRDSIVGWGDSHKNYLYASFPRESTHVPIICYTITRILPLCYLYEG
jgi:hypothetical protein